MATFDSGERNGLQTSEFLFFDKSAKGLLCQVKQDSESATPKPTARNPVDHLTPQL